ncbi:MAG: tRNA lysidine(34) synthetase TilS, partial [Gammaproteobacteria bacterium]|nr:tRNA lysidine(34) synthetase TilS [Gammaproteobacteria bacterium]
LQLLRGAGVDGLAAMPTLREWRGGWIGRPLLDVSRAALRAWAEANAVAWVEDPSNAELGADRNYLRHAVMPRLRERWPAADARLAHSAALCGEAAARLAAATADDLAALATAQPDQLRLDRLCALGDARARAVLRFWLRTQGLPALPATRLREAVQQLCTARPGAGVEIAWSGLALRRYRDRVWIGMRQLPVGGWPRVAWRGEGLPLGDRRGRVTRTWGPGGIDPGRWSRGTVEVGVRHSGMRCRPAGRGGTRSFKNLVQECGIPPWLRDHLPVVWIDGRVAAIADCCVCDTFAAADGASGWHVHWQRPGLPDRD